MSKRKKSHRTTKNTAAKPPITRMCVISGKIHDDFTIVTDYDTGKQFQTLFQNWQDDPKTNYWCVEALIMYIKEKRPGCVCVLKSDYDEITEGKVIHATKEEYESENN